MLAALSGSTKSINHLISFAMKISTVQFGAVTNYCLQNWVKTENIIDIFTIKLFKRE